MLMKFLDGFVEARFVKRVNRFVAKIDIAGQEHLAHVPNSGRMRELLLPGASVLAAVKGTGPLKNRKTDYDLSLVLFEGRWVSIDSRLPNKLLEQMIEQQKLPEHSPLRDAAIIKKEPAYSHGRFDLLLAPPKGTKKGDAISIYVECKSVTLVDEQRALFPDAPTARGKRHLEALSEAVHEGHRGVVVFLVQRDDAVSFSPNWEMDPLFAHALQKAHTQGVIIESYAFRVTPEGVWFDQELPVSLAGGQSDGVE